MKTAVGAEDSFEKIRNSQKKYQKTTKGKESAERYLKSEKGRESLKKYLNSEKGKDARLRYYLSEKGQTNKERQSERTKLAAQCIDWCNKNPGKTPLDFFNYLNSNE